MGATGPDITKKSLGHERPKEEEDVPATQPFVASTATAPEAPRVASATADGEEFDAVVLQAFKNLEEFMIDGSTGRHKQFEELTTKEQELISYFLENKDNKFQLPQPRRSFSIINLSISFSASVIRSSNLPQVRSGRF